MDDSDVVDGGGYQGPDRRNGQALEQRLIAHVDRLVAEIQQQRLRDQLDIERTYATRATQHEDRQLIQSAVLRLEVHERRIDANMQNAMTHEREAQANLLRLEKLLDQQRDDRSQAIERLRADLAAARAEINAELTRVIDQLRGEVTGLRGDVTGGWRTNGGYVIVALISLIGIVATFVLSHGVFH